MFLQNIVNMIHANASMVGLRLSHWVSIKLPVRSDCHLPAGQPRLLKTDVEESAKMSIVTKITLLPLDNCQQKNKKKNIKTAYVDPKIIPKLRPKTFEKSQLVKIK